MLETTLELSGGVYGIVIVGEDCIPFTRLPSATDFNDLHCWSCPVDTTTSVDFTFCAVQDLLVVVAYSPDPRIHADDIHLRSLTTNEIHADAAQPILKTVDKDCEIVQSTNQWNAPRNSLYLLSWIMFHTQGQSWA
ncbi:uncharacterized protein HD556DRAFT_269508 [Suillus plorans]|uniref:Uncharacterized protein n=1 Tax=Suillus plorans TaxID=116603 RepID=A0A9P7IXB5_9AGAM|nr:uncharacterized protein HD556DRAFT_269508 [Suillus plorans]KAG1797038.1 hypothetical protein HD556DRAFT_269508 [Suillus plorans]